MKKLFIAAVAAFALVACTTEKTNGATDSTKVDTSKVDTLRAKLVKADTLVKDTVTKVVAKKDTIKAKIDTVVKKHKTH
jgi:uncharacterized protein YcfL